MALVGSRDENLQVVEDLLVADVHVRGNEVTLSGESAEVASSVPRERIQEIGVV